MLKPAQFTVETLDAGVGEVLVYIEDPEGHTEEVRGDPPPRVPVPSTLWGHWGRGLGLCAPSR